MKTHLTSLVLTALLVLASVQAQAQTADAPRAVDSTTSTAQADRPVRLRASHRVDVIAPGEHVESVIDRMRANRPLPQTAPTDGQQNGQRPPMRPPDKRADREGGPDDARGGNAGRPPPGGGGPDRPHR